MDALSGGGNVPPAKSYSPFGASKPVSPTAPAGANVPPTKSYSPFGASKAVGPTAPAAPSSGGAASGGSYMDALSGGANAPPTKSYSPFGASKPVAATSSPLPITDDPTAPAAQSSGGAASEGSYMDSLSGGANVPITESYSPVGASEPAAAPSSPLPPSVGAVPEASESYAAYRRNLSKSMAP
jgi:hypothetical protein